MIREDLGIELTRPEERSQGVDGDCSAWIELGCAERCGNK